MLIDKDLWIEKTGGNTPRTRSIALRRLDDAIGVANRTQEPGPRPYEGSTPSAEAADHELAAALCAMTLAHVHDTLQAWMQEQNTKHSAGWRSSIRNRDGAVEAMSAELQKVRLKYDAEQAAALDALKKARDASIPALFQGCKCISRSASRDFLNDVITAGQTITSGADLVLNVRRVVRSKDAAASAPVLTESLGASLSLDIEGRIQDLVKKAFDLPVSQLRWELGEKFFADIVEHALAGIRQELASAVPFFGLVGAAAILGYATHQLADAASGARAVGRLHQRTVPSDSKSALASIRRWQEGDLQLLKERVARATLNLGSQIAGVASGGTLTLVQGSVGICNAVVALVDVIVEIGRQYQESRALTRYLNNQDGQHPLGREIFCAAPLAGAYFILNTPASHIALQLVDFGAAGWREDVERLALHGDLARTRDEAARLIDLSRYRIVPREGRRYIEAVDKTFLKKLDAWRST